MKKYILVAFLFYSSYGFAQDTTFTQLFNGKDLTGWEHLGPGKFSVEDGMLKTEGGLGLLWFTKEKFSDVVLRVIYKTIDSANSGIFIRIPEKPKDEWYAVHNGYEVQIDESDNEYHCTGVLYSFTKAEARPGKVNEWNTMEIYLEGNNTRVILNGVEVTNFKEGDAVPPKKLEWEPERRPRPESGYIGLQNHSEADIVFFKEVSVKRDKLKIKN